MNIIVRAALIASSLALVVLLVRPAISDFLVPDVKDPALLKAAQVEKAILVTPEDAQYHRLLGTLSLLGLESEGFEKAVGHYTHSLQRNPTDAFTWLNLMKSSREVRPPDYGVFAAHKAVVMDRYNPAVTWESGVYLLTSGQTDESVKLLRRYLTMSPQDQDKVYALFFTIGIPARYTLDNLVPPSYEFYKGYLRFLSANRLVDESTAVWDRMKGFDLAREDYIAYCNALIGAAEIRAALGVWKDFVTKFNILGGKSPAADLLWNPSFDLPVENGCFDWQLGKTEGVRVFIDRDVKMSGGSSLSALFDGSSNPDIVLAHQIVAIEPGRTYKLVGYVKADKLTTKNGVFLEVAGYKCSPLYAQTDSVTGTSTWQRLEVDFTVPPECTTVRVAARRAKSEKLDNKISGDAWVESLSLSLVEKRYSEPKPEKARVQKKGKG